MLKSAGDSRMAEGGNAFSSDEEYSSSSSSPSSIWSFSGINRAKFNSGSEGTSSNTSSTGTEASSGGLHQLREEGIYGWIVSLINEGKVARFVDRQRGIYELDWQIVVWKYWFDWRRSRRGDRKTKSPKNIKFNHRTASNTLRAALLNAYKDKGAMEFSEKIVMDRRKRTIKRRFRLPSTMTHKFARHFYKASKTSSVSPKSTEAFGDSPEYLHSSPHPQIASIDFSSLNIDAKESESLIKYLTEPDQHEKLDDPFLGNGHSIMVSNHKVLSSGYETAPEGSVEENLVQEIDPNEGPYQGGNTAFIFLGNSPSGISRESGCKVVFYEPKQRLAASEVTAAVKNPFTVKIIVPHCPRLSGAQLARGKLTVNVLVSTLDGRYIGETTYTYNASLMTQFEQCVKALDEDHMDVDIQCAKEGEASLNYRLWDLSGSHALNFASLRVMAFVAVKETAIHFLTSLLNSPVAWQVLQHCKNKLLSFVEHLRSRNSQSDEGTSVLDLCERFLLNGAEKCERPKNSEPMLPARETDTNACKNTVVKSERRYDGSSEHETSNDLEGEVHKVKEKEKTDACDIQDTLFQYALREKAGEGEFNDSLNDKPKILVLRRPCSVVPISRSRAGFPDPRTDIFVELQVRKSQNVANESSEKLGYGSQHVMHHVTVDVRHSATKEIARDWESKYVKRVSGKIGYWFRFYEPNCELLIMFTLHGKPQVIIKPEKNLRRASFEVLDHVTVVVETTTWKLPLSRGTEAGKDYRNLKVPLTIQVPLLSLTREQSKLCKIMNDLHKLCDNGDWVKFEKECANLQRHSSSPDFKVAILLEKTIALLYKHQLEEAETTALEALKVASKAKNHQLLAGKAYYYLAHVYRRERKLGKAVQCIDLSKQNLHLMDVCLDQSFMAYEEGNVMKEFISSGAFLRKKLVLRAKQCFERCLDLCRRVDKSDSSAIPATHSFALIKIAMLLLDCGSSSGRERCVTTSHIQEAKRFLNLIERRGLDEITERRKIQYLLACSDLHYRICNYHMAIYYAEEALKKAKEFGFVLEVLPARNRLSHLCQMLVPNVL